MERLVKGDVVVVPFAFTDLSDVKRRPAVVLSNPIMEDVVVCQITTLHGENTIPLKETDFESGKLASASFIKPWHVSTVKMKRVLYKIGRLKKAKWVEVSKSLCTLFAP